jgi:branched-chain amino acid transport system ATP-binding protein
MAVPAMVGVTEAGMTAAAGVPVPALRTTHVTWRAGGVTILDGIDLTVHIGEFLAVIGPNGAGKTSLFHVLSGIRRPDAGRVELLGTDVTRLSTHRRARLGLGRTFQTSSVFGSLSVSDNVALATHAAARRTEHGRWSRRRADKVDGYLERVGLSHLRGVPAAVLSHGDKRKLDIALVLAAQPRVILLDEPLAGVATADIPDLLTVVAGLTRGPDECTVVMVEHHLESVLRLADRIAVLHHGALLACDTPPAIVGNPAVQQAYLGQEP